MTSTMLFDPVGHVDNEALDLYSGQRLSPEDEDAVRQHLRVCPECRDRLEKESYFRASVVGNRDLWEQPPAKELSRDNRWRLFSPNLPGVLSHWRPIAGVAALVVLAMLLPRTWPVAPAESVDVTLQAMRGESPSDAPAGRYLQLRLDLHGMPSADPLTVEVVNQRGAGLAAGQAQVQDGMALFTLPQPLDAGQYWVRLVVGGRQVKEYSLKVQ